jgi:hypothetical protein
MRVMTAAPVRRERAQRRVWRVPASPRRSAPASTVRSAANRWLDQRDGHRSEYTARSCPHLLRHDGATDQFGDLRD